MESFVYILSGLSTALAGLNISQYFFFRSQRKKADASAEQEQNTADAGKFENLEKEIEFLGKLVDKYRSESEQARFKQENFDRRLRGIQKLLSREIGLKKYAEKHICLNIECKDRRPGLGEFHTEDPVIPEES